MPRPEDRRPRSGRPESRPRPAGRHPPEALPAPPAVVESPHPAADPPRAARPPRAAGSQPGRCPYRPMLTAGDIDRKVRARSPYRAWPHLEAAGPTGSAARKSTPGVNHPYSHTRCRVPRPRGRRDHRHGDTGAGRRGQKLVHCVGSLSTSTAKVTCYDSFTVAIAEATGGRVTDALAGAAKVVGNGAFGHRTTVMSAAAAIMLALLSSRTLAVFSPPQPMPRRGPPPPARSRRA